MGADQFWLSEELGLSYELIRYTRDPVTVLAPPELKALHTLGSAPLMPLKASRAFSTHVTPYPQLRK